MERETYEEVMAVLDARQDAALGQLEAIDRDDSRFDYFVGKDTGLAEAKEVLRKEYESEQTMEELGWIPGTQMN